MTTPPFAVPHLYLRHQPCLHRSPSSAEIALLASGGAVARDGCALRVPHSAGPDALRAFCGPAGARLMTVLYRIANDEPFWRSPRIRIRSSHLLDTYGYRRERRGHHSSFARRRVRSLLDGAAGLSLETERSTGPLLHVPALTARAGGGLPVWLDIELGHYDGVRRRGALGRDYVLVPELSGLRRGPQDEADVLLGYLSRRRRQVRRDRFTLRRGVLQERLGLQALPARLAGARIGRLLARLIRSGAIARVEDIPGTDAVRIELRPLAVGPSGLAR